MELKVSSSQERTRTVRLAKLESSFVFGAYLRSSKSKNSHHSDAIDQNQQQLRLAPNARPTSPGDLHCLKN